MGRVTNILTAGLCILHAHATSYSKLQNCTHGPNDRGCWKDGFNILSDYTNNSIIPPGRLVEV